MGKNCKKTHKNLPNVAGIKYTVVDEFDETGADLLDDSIDGCFYLGKNWNKIQHSDFIIAIPREKIYTLSDLVYYKFGVNDFSNGKFFYFVWSSKKQFKNKKNRFAESIVADSLRFWKTIIMLLKNKKKRRNKKKCLSQK